MRRRLSSILAILSLICCILLCGLWVRSHWVGYQVSRMQPGQFLNVTAARGTLAVDTGEAIGPKGIEWWLGSNQDLDPAVAAGTGPGRFGYERRLSGFVIWFPLWFPALVALIPPAFWLYRRRKQGVKGFPVEAHANA